MMKMATSKNYKLCGVEIPKEADITAVQLKQFIVLLTEYMGADAKKQTKILEKYPFFEPLYDIFETKIVKKIRQRLEVRGQLDAFE